jgi:tRNA (guanosine-2'-O-)-methyltransferase
MTPNRVETIHRVLSQRQPDLTVITDEAHKARNLSAIIRSCDAVGVGTFHCVTPKKGFRSYRGTASGSNKWVTTQNHESISDGIKSLKKQGFRIVAANLSSKAVDFREVDYSQPTAILMGSEKSGVSSQALELCDQQVIIPMMGMVESYNVSVACAIILNEAQRQRQVHGMYSHCRLDDDSYKKAFFQWCQPVIAKYCDDNDISYPELDSDGDLNEPSEWYTQVKSI